jgi:drug/metabolite transporter (DMT)-like permease
LHCRREAPKKPDRSPPGYPMDSTSATPAASAESRLTPGGESMLPAIGLVLLSVALFSIMDALSKILAARLDAIEIVWGRYLVILALLAPLVGRDPRSLLAARPALQAVRGICLFASAVLFIAGLAFLPLADASAIAFASPMVVTALSIPILGEQVGIRRWSAVAAGFVGVLIVIRPGTGAFDAAALLPLLSAACWALSIVLTRRMGRHDKPLTTLLYSTVVGLVLSSLALPFVWRPASVADWMLIIAMGGLNAGGQYFLIAGLMRGAASLLAPFTYSQIVWSTLLGYLIFGALPTVWTWSGAALIVASGVYIAHRERVRRTSG